LLVIVIGRTLESVCDEYGVKLSEEDLDKIASTVVETGGDYGAVREVCKEIGASKGLGGPRLEGFADLVAAAALQYFAAVLLAWRLERAAAQKIAC